MDARNAITDSLDAQGIGNFVGAGGGFSQMDFEYDFADAEIAKKQIAAAMQQYLPGRHFEVIVE